MPRRIIVAIAFAFAVIAPAVSRAGSGPVLAVMKFQDETGAMPFQGGIGRVVTTVPTHRP